MVITMWFRTLWAYRSFILTSIVAEHKSRFARSRLGWLWLLLGPMAQAAIFAVVLSKIVSAKLPNIENEYSYTIYLLSGIAAWSLFAEVTTRSVGIFRQNANVIKKMFFPKICLSIIMMGSSLINSFMLFASVIMIYIIMDYTISVEILVLPALVFLTALLAHGLGLILAVFNVFLADIEQAFGVFIQLWFWGTPIVYTIDMVPESFAVIFALNPMVHLIGGFRDVMVYHRWPDLAGMAVLLLLAVVLNTVALLLYRRAKNEITEAI